MIEHTQGKLSLIRQHADAELRDAAGNLVAVIVVDSSPADARRIVAAWNACQGIPTEVLEAQQSGGLPWRVADQIGARVDIASLAGALGVFVAHSSSEETITITVRNEHIRRARELIARATGGKTT